MVAQQVVAQLMVRPNSGDMLTNAAAAAKSRPPGETRWLAISPAWLSLFTGERMKEKKSLLENLSSYRYMITGATKETLFRTELTGQEKKSLLWKQSYACLGNWNAETLLFATQSSHKDKSRIELSTTRFKAFQFPKNLQARNDGKTNTKMVNVRKNP